jgi:hypothetical protein
LTGHYHMLALLMARDPEWVTWGPNHTCVIKTVACRLAMGCNWGQFESYLAKLEAQGYLKIMKRAWGKITLQMLSLNRGMVESVTRLPATDLGGGSSDPLPCGREGDPPSAPVVVINGGVSCG